jgi:predicted nucleotide-binding protein
MYYHVYIILENGPDWAENDLIKEELERRIINPYEKGEKFMSAGYNVDPYNIKRIQISQTKESSGKILPMIYAKEARSRVIAAVSTEFKVFEYGEDVTKHFILGPAGYQKETIVKDDKVYDEKKMFIVHGRDELSKTQLARMLEKMKMKPIILHEQPNRGMTLIEKLEYYSKDIGYAFVILTPDDIGCLQGEYIVEGPMVKAGLRSPIGALKPRARQNVVFELGWFQGKLGRKNVCLLYKRDVELPTDINGMVYSEFRESVEECYQDIINEIRDVGYKPQV